MFLLQHSHVIINKVLHDIKNIEEMKGKYSWKSYNLYTRRESSVNTRLGADHHQLIMPPISKDCSNTFLERSFIYAAPCEWNKLSECIRTSTFDSFRKSVKTILFTQEYGC